MGDRNNTNSTRQLHPADRKQIVWDCAARSVAMAVSVKIEAGTLQPDEDLLRLVELHDEALAQYREAVKDQAVPA